MATPYFCCFSIVYTTGTEYTVFLDKDPHYLQYAEPDQKNCLPGYLLGAWWGRGGRRRPQQGSHPSPPSSPLYPRTSLHHHHQPFLTGQSHENKVWLGWPFKETVVQDDPRFSIYVKVSSVPFCFQPEIRTRDGRSRGHSCKEVNILILRLIKLKAVSFLVEKNNYFCSLAGGWCCLSSVRSPRYWSPPGWWGHPSGMW